MSTGDLIMVWLICIAVGIAINRGKNRPVSEGALLAGLLGIIGIIILLFLKPLPAPNAVQPLPQALPPAGWYTDPTNAGTQRYWDGTAWAPPQPSH